MAAVQREWSGVQVGAAEFVGGTRTCGAALSCAVVVPTFNHGQAISSVLQALENIHLPIIVVDDGSTDSTEAYLSDWSSGGEPPLRRVVVRHERNMGKAAAIRTGLEKALQLGCTHVATIDSDGQHDVSDLSGLLEHVSAHPDALIIGARTRGQASVPYRSRIGRVLSNALIWIESGIQVRDSQSGMRVYPIVSTMSLGAVASRYGFETEVLVRAGWSDVRVVEHSIHCIYDPPGGRSTHFRVWGDTAAAVCMHARLLVRALGPNQARKGRLRTGTIPRRVGRWFSPRGLARMATGDAVSRHRFAASISVGLVIATLPIYGLKTLLSMSLAAQMNLHPLAVVAVSSLSTPPIGIVFIAYAVCVGSLVLGGSIPDLSGFDASTATQWATAGDLLLEWIVGSVIGGLALGIASYLMMRPILAWSVKHRASG